MRDENLLAPRQAQEETRGKEEECGTAAHLKASDKLVQQDNQAVYGRGATGKKGTLGNIMLSCFL